jgi:hypothetical protein
MVPETGVSMGKDKLRTGSRGMEEKAVGEAGPGIALPPCPGLADYRINRSETELARFHPAIEMLSIHRDH